ncbi:hypothetical protein LTR53_003208 [Teratosphaeriaceae sp. CCFEE 6253]|nr:hypothetical protein LTR53_003208 [Teratosphaeriaceae sp. CCFEE 6253]
MHEKTEDVGSRDVESQDLKHGISPASSERLDETYALYKQDEALPLDPHEASKVLRRIDLHLIPLLFLTYMLQYLDKSSINFASVFGIQKGTHLHGQQYAWLSSIFYL